MIKVLLLELIKGENIQVNILFVLTQEGQSLILFEVYILIVSKFRRYFHKANEDIFQLQSQKFGLVIERLNEYFFIAFTEEDFGVESHHIGYFLDEGRVDVR